MPSLERQTRCVRKGHTRLRRTHKEDPPGSCRRERPAYHPDCHLQLRRTRASQKAGGTRFVLLDFVYIVLTRKTAQPTKEVSESEERHKSPRRRSKRSASADSDQPRQRKKKSKKKKRTEAEEETPKEENKLSGEPHQETEEEYDARLEREENERLEAARKQELERVKRRYESELEVKDGVRFKGNSALPCIMVAFGR